jgi:2-phospho-L-lactate/phosphoenolpyruvate guanylyltransferase
MRTIVVVPMKDAAMSKTRLADVMPAADRERMSLALFERAQEFFRVQFPHFSRLVVTPSSSIAALAKIAGAAVLMEDGAQGLNSAALSSFDWACRAGFDRLLIVPADIPVWLRAEVDELLEEGTRYPVVIARAHDGGTNALLFDLACVNRFDFRYGPDSACRHSESANAVGVRARTRTWHFLSHDIDTVADCLILSQKLAALTNTR